MAAAGPVSTRHRPQLQAFEHPNSPSLCLEVEPDAVLEGPLNIEGRFFPFLGSSFSSFLFCYLTATLCLICESVLFVASAAIPIGEEEMCTTEHLVNFE